MRRIAILLSCLLVSCLVPLVTPTPTPTPLDEYVWREDPNYSWFDTGETLKGHNIGREVEWVGYILNMTSQRWLTDNDTTRSLWWHYLLVIVPSNYDADHPQNATLWITDGKNTDSMPTRSNYNVLVASEMAMGTGMITGSLFQVPNEKMTFKADPEQKERGEDSIIAYTWDHFLKNLEEPEWLLRFPMVKASLRAMDTMTSFARENLGIPDMNYYCVSGASKRGWTTWDVGAVDSGRVRAIVPVVLDAINFVVVEHHQFRSYGGWSYLLQDYWEANITSRYDTPAMQLLSEHVDPYYYRERLTMPKLVVNAGQDEFQQPDDTHYWWADMPEPKHFLMMPNTDHSCMLGMAQLIPAIGTFFSYHIRGYEVPSLKWTISNTTGDIRAVVTGGTGAVKVKKVTKWWAKTCNSESPSKYRRDFRLTNLDSPCSCGVTESDGTCLNEEAARWYSEPVTMNSDGSYTAHMDIDEDGRWTAFFMDLTFDNININTNMNHKNKNTNTQEDEDGANKADINNNHRGTWPYQDYSTYLNPKNGQPLHLGTWPDDAQGALDFTTEVSIWPNTFPFEACSGAECYGTLL